MKRIRLICIVVAVIVFGGMVIAIFRGREPRYEGRTLTEWIEGADKETKSEAELQAAGHAVKQMAPAAIPVLLKWVQVNDSPFKRKIIEWLDNHPFFHFRIKSSGEYHKKAWIGFCLLGDQAQPALPTLIQLTYSTEPEIRYSALACLADSNPDSETFLRILLRLVHDKNKLVQFAASEKLHLEYPRDAEAAGVYKLFPDWENELTDETGTNQAQAK